MDIFYFYLNLAGAMLNMVIGFLNIGTSEMLLIVFVALLLFGGKKLPELARGLGRGIREFKDASESIKRDISQQINDFEEDLDVKNLLVDEKNEKDEKPVTKSEQNKASDTSPKSEIPAAFQSGPPAGTYQHTRGREPDYQGNNTTLNTPNSEVNTPGSEDNAPSSEIPTTDSEADTKK